MSDRATAVSTEPSAALLSSADIAERLNVGEPYVELLRHRHGLPYIRVGSEIRFSWDEVSAWLARRSVSALAGGRSA
jgi:excisionase family DNA binding protein